MLKHFRFPEFVILCVPAAPSQPSYLSFSEVTGGSVNVSWGAPLTPNGQLEGYRVIYQPTVPVQGVQTHTHLHMDATRMLTVKLTFLFNCLQE